MRSVIPSICPSRLPDFSDALKVTQRPVLSPVRAVRVAVVFASLLTAVQAFGQWTPQATQVLNYCLAQPDNCSVSINHVTGNWRRDYNGSRLNVLASTVKLVPLLAYGQAVVDGKLNPKTIVSRDEWAAFWTGQDGDAFSDAWDRLGQPQSVTLEQMVGAMLRESENATPDYLLDKLGPNAMEEMIRRYVPGYVDPPQSLAALFTSWMGVPSNPLLGAANIAQYSGIESFGYRKFVGELFRSLHDPDAVRAQRRFVCAGGVGALPWEASPRSCRFGSDITEPVWRTVTTRYFPKSNTRTYTDLMTGLLQRNLLPADLQKVIEPYLEWRVSTAIGQNFRRYGGKSGNLGTLEGGTILTWTGYVETRQNAPNSDHGTQAVVTIQLRDPTNRSDALPPLISGVIHFADALVLDPAFAAMVVDRLPNDSPLPDLIARISDLGFGSSDGPTRIEVRNIGTAAPRSTSLLQVFQSKSRTLTSSELPVYSAQIPQLEPGGSRTLTVNLKHDGRFVIVVIDPKNEIPESDNQNNVTYEQTGPSN